MRVVYVFLSRFCLSPAQPRFLPSACCHRPTARTAGLDPSTYLPNCRRRLGLYEWIHGYRRTWVTAVRDFVVCWAARARWARYTQGDLSCPGGEASNFTRFLVFSCHAWETRGFRPGAACFGRDGQLRSCTCRVQLRTHVTSSSGGGGGTLVLLSALVPCLSDCRTGHWGPRGRRRDSSKR